MSDRSIKLADIQAGAKRASEAFDRWPQWKREISEGKQMNERSIKLEVDRCDQCPFGQWHGASIVRRCHYGEGYCGEGREVGSGSAPDWCPIRGKVVIIGGPKK